MSSIKIIGRTIGIIILAIVVLVCAAWVLVHTPPVNRFLLSKIGAKVQSSIGAKVRIGKLSLGWTHLSADLQDVVIFGPEGPSQPPFFTVRRASAQIDFLPLFHKNVRIAYIRLDQPVIRFLVDRDGNSNLPHPQKSNAHSNAIRTLLNLQVRDFTLRTGELELRDEKIPLSAELHNLQSQLKYEAQQQAYAGTISYPRGTFSSGTLPSTVHALHADFTLTESLLNLHPVKVDFGRSHFDGNLQLTLTSPLRLAGNYEADLFGADVSSAIGTAIPVKGEFTTAGKLAYQSKPNATFAESFDAAGEVRSNLLTVHYGQLAPEVRGAYARYSLQSGTLHAWNVAGITLGGTLSGDFEMPRIESHPRWQVSANLRGASLSQLDRMSQNQYQSLQRVRLEGIANISVNLHSSSSGTRVHARVAMSNPNQRLPRGMDIPLSGLLDVSYDSASGVANFGQSHLQLGATRVALSGALSRTAQLHVQASTTDLHQLVFMTMDMAQRFRPSRTTGKGPSIPPSLQSLNGAMQFAGTVSGRLKSPRIAGQLSAQNLQVENTRWSSFAVNIQADPSRAFFQNGVLQNGAATKINFGGQVALHNWTFAAQNKIQFHSSLRGISIAEIERVAGKNYPVEGTLNANVNVSGAINQLNGSGEFQISDASFWKQQVDTLNGNAQLKQGNITAAANAKTPAGQIDAKVNYSLSAKQFQASVATPALNLSQIQAAGAQKFGIAGTLKGYASAHGSIDQPSATASFQVADLQVRGQSVSQAQAHFQLAGKHASFSATASRDEIKAQLSGDVDLQGQYPLHAKLDVPSLSIGALLAGYSSSARQVQGQTEIHATIDGPIKNPAALHAVVNIPTLTLGYQSLHWALVRPLHAEYADSVLTV
ncbi:MAG TPA: AsmA family protein, partial [Verrucomicrobiae bacterium]|nr:AsmA family protein [Verrucomicrobiae bacterium]